MRILCTGLLAILLPFAAAQTPPVPSNGAEIATQDETVTFESRTSVVQVPVVVRDRTGVLAERLTKEDFQLFDKGKPQTISRFSVERAGAVAPPQVLKTATRTHSSGEVPEDAPQRFVSLFFDDVNLSIGDLAAARAAAEKFLDSGLRPRDRLSVATTSGAGQMSFTDDVAQVRKALELLRPRAVSKSTGAECPSVTFYLADLIINRHDNQALYLVEREAYACMRLTSIDEAEQISRSSAAVALAAGRQESSLAFDALKSLIRRMSGMPGQRVILMISPGFLRLDENLVEESTLIDRAVKAGVTINTLDARGLYVDATNSPAQRILSSSVALEKEQYARAANRLASDVMAELAAGTGGAFFENSNDLTAGVKQLASAPEVVYVLSFSPTSLKTDGGYHPLRVTLRNPAGFSVRARAGYYAPNHLANGAEEAREEITQTLFSREELHDIPAAMHTEFLKTSDDEARLTVTTRIDVRRLRFRKAEGRNGNELLVVSGLFDRNGNFLNSVTKRITMRLKDETLQGGLNGRVAVHADFRIAPGRYLLRLVVRDAEGKMMTAQNGAVEIP